MKTWRTIQKIAVAVGMTYGLWLGTNVGATDADSRNAFVIIILVGHRGYFAVHAG